MGPVCVAIPDTRDISQKLHHVAQQDARSRTTRRTRQLTAQSRCISLHNYGKIIEIIISYGRLRLPQDVLQILRKRKS